VLRWDAILSLFAFPALFCLLPEPPRGGGAHPAPFFVFAATLACATVAFGAWRLTTQNPAALGAARHTNLRVSIRLGTIISLIACLLEFQILRHNSPELRLALLCSDFVLATLGRTAQICILTYIIYLARDIPDFRLASKAKGLSVFAIIVVALLTATILLESWSQFQNFSQSARAAVGFAAVPAMLSYTVLLIMAADLLGKFVARLSEDPQLSVPPPGPDNAK
jgi:hypothetical protein